MSAPVYDFDEIIDRSNTNSAKVDAVPFMNPDLPDDFISMWVADQDFACAPPIIDAMKRRLDQRVLGYTIILDPTYKKSVVDWMKKRHDWDVKASWSIFTAGVVKAVDIAVDLLSKEGDGIVLNTPAYHPFDDIAKKKNRKIVYSPLKVDDAGYYTYDFDDLEKKCKDPNNKLFILCNPHNPTGRVWNEDELRRIGKICFDNDMFIISDEIHSDLLRCGKKHIPLAKIFPNEKRLIVCTAPSKTFNLAGNQLSNIFIPDVELRTKWEMSRLGGFPNPLSVEACKACYNECESWLDQMKVYLDGNFKLLSDRLKAELPQAVFSVSEGTYLAWVDLRKLGFSDDELKRRITRGGVFIEYSSDFVANAEGHVRINVSCPRKVLNNAIDIIVKSLTSDYVAPQFQGQLSNNQKFPSNIEIESISGQQKSLKSLFGERKTIIIFLRYFGCPICQLELQELEEHFSEITANDVKLVVVLNSSKANFETNSNKKQYPFEVLFDLEGKSYDQLKIREAKAMNFLFDMKTAGKIDVAEDKGIIHYDKEEKSRELQRPATFIINSKDDTVEFVKYGHGAGDVPSIEELKKLI